MTETNSVAFRRTREEDIPFYASMLRDREWVEGTGLRCEDFMEDDVLRRFITPHTDKEIKWLAYIKETQAPIGFCHFKEIQEGLVEITGGLVKERQDTGIGIECYVVCIHNYFQLGLCDNLQVTIWQENLRSLKMNLSMGFELVGLTRMDSRKFDVLTLTRDHFYTANLTRRILRVYGNKSIQLA